MARKFIENFVIIAALLAMQTAYADEMEVNQQLPSLGSETGFIRGPSGDIQEVSYENRGRIGLFEGDILVNPATHSKFLQNSRPNGVVIDGNRWPNNTLYYKFDSVSVDVMIMVRSAAQHIRNSTNVNIIELQSGETTPYHVRVQSTDFASYSYVGKINFSSTSQPLNVVPQCGFGATVHEFLHALGMWHEQSREDRNNFVTINYANIQAGKEHNFNQQINGSSDILAYDYGSIMHYGSTAFSSNGLPTIESIPPGQTLGQRNGMSATDISTINDIYPNASAPDLVVNAPSVNNSTIGTGGSFTLSATVRNQGNANANTSTLTYFRSNNATISTSDSNVGNDPVSSLSAGASSPENIVLVAPTTAGNYYYGACVSSVTGEASTSNNCSSGVLVSVTGPDGYEPNNSSGQAKSINLSRPQSHSLHVVGDQDWVQFTTTEVSNVTIQTSGSSGDDTTLELFDDGLQSIKFNDNGGQGRYSKIVMNALPAGTYYAVV